MSHSAVALISRHVRLHLCVAVVCLSATAPAGAATPGGWTTARPPAWVTEAPLPSSDTPLRSGAGSGRLYLLVDHQVRIGPALADYHRFAWTPLSTTGVQNASDIQVRFDPAFQRLVIHHVRLLRDGRDVFAFRPTDVRIIQQERDLDEQIYSGELTAVVFLRDLRPGDVVDYAYSLEGTNPIVHAAYDDDLPLAYESPVRVVRHVVRAPEGVALHISPRHTTVEPRVDRSGGWQVYTWEARDVVATAADNDEPGWFDPDPRIEISTFGSWADVADWARGLFESQILPSAELDRLVARFRSAGGGPAAAAAEATRFVQDEVRYLGIEMGPNSHQPHPPEQVLRQRFGDCKDKALLLVALLRALGIDAAPALVDTVRRRGLDDTQPSPFAFDHVIVRATIAGRETWIDATESDMGGRLEDRQPPEFERALVLVPGTSSLTRIPLASPRRPTVEVVETFTLGAGGNKTRLQVVSTYRDAEADAMRRTLAETPAAELAKTFLDDYVKDEPEIKATAPPTAKDDRGRNVVTVSETYEVPSFWKNRKRELRGWAVADRLPRSVPVSRRTPVSVPHPVHVRHEVIVRADGRLRLGPYSERVKGEAFAFSAALATSGRELHLTFDYQSLADSVAPDRLKAHQEALARVEDAVSFLVLPDYSSPDAPQAPWQSDGVLVGVGGTGIAAGAAVAFAIGRRRRTSSS